MIRYKTPYGPLPLGSVELTDAWCRNALKKEIEYLLSLEEGRLLAGFYENAGIRTPYVRYGGWESGLIGGHTLGHYLTALAQAYANAGTPKADREKIHARIVRIVDTLAECQTKMTNGGGFLWGAPPAKAGYPEAQFDNLERGKTNIQTEAWVPWYTMHKILAGLLDAYRYTEYVPALKVAEGLGEWISRRTRGWSEKLRAKVLAVEYGGMNDCLYELYAFTGRAEFAICAHAFDEEPLFDAILTEGKDVLKGRHANTTIPKIVGALNRYLTLHGQELAGEVVDASRYLKVCEAFFRIVTERHTYVTGGNSEWEHFGADYVLDKKRTNCNCETCNVYNMLKLARGLFAATGKKIYTDYYDNAFTNAILSSQNPETGMTTYFQPMASGFFKVYSRPYDKFWCCTGSGMENFTKLGDSALYTDGENLIVEQYLSARVVYAGKELEITCDFPLSDTATIRILRAERPFDLLLRVPDWADDAPTLFCGGRAVCSAEHGGHLRILAKAGDEITLKIPVAVSLKGLPDGDALAFRYGGAVLSADLGTEEMEESETGVEVTIPARKKLATECVYFRDLCDVFETPSKYLVREGDEFRLIGGDIALNFGLHYRRYRGRYAIYLRLREGERRAETAHREPLDAVQVGYGQYESDELHALEEHHCVSATDLGTSRYALAGGYFAYDMAVAPSGACILSVELLRADNGRTLRITAGGEEIFAERLCYTMGEESYRREILLPEQLIARVGKKKTVGGKELTVVRIRFEGFKGRQSARVNDFIYIY